MFVTVSIFFKHNFLKMKKTVVILSALAVLCSISFSSFSGNTPDPDDDGSKPKVQYNEPDPDDDGPKPKIR